MTGNAKWYVVLQFFMFHGNKFHIFLANVAPVAHTFPFKTKCSVSPKSSFLDVLWLHYLQFYYVLYPSQLIIPDLILGSQQPSKMKWLHHLGQGPLSFHSSSNVTSLWMPFLFIPALGKSCVSCSVWLKHITCRFQAQAI